ncbi:MAG: hypothetical protein JNK87_26465 [Bryobacterales bacterium]|nr:hypothetical protein [Bryobacterales bacterium]
MVTGYVVDARNATLRAIQGLPGAATVGPAVNIAAPVSAASVIWNGTSGMDALVAGTNGELYQYREADGTLQCTPVQNSIGRIDYLARNRRNSRPALTYSSHSRLLQWQTTAGAGPAIPATAELATIELAPDGERAIATGRCTADETGGLYEIRRNSLSRLPFNGCPISPLFFHNGRDLLVADGLRHQVLHVQDAFETGQVRILAGLAAGIDSPIALALDDAARTLLVLTRHAGLFLIDLDRAEVTANLSLPFQPTQLRRLLLPNTFLLSDTAESPLYVAVLDGTPKLLFVPVQP